MNNRTNFGILTESGGHTEITGSEVSIQTRIAHGRPEAAGSSPRGTWDIGVVTTLPEEAQAVLDMFGLSRDRDTMGTHWFYTGRVTVPGALVTMVATRTSGPGQRSAMSALENVNRLYQPAIMVLVGVGGAVHPDVAVDDVVVATRVVYYDLRKVTAERVLHRGEEHRSPASMIHSVNSFFTDHGEPARLNLFRVHSGMIGSGDAVIADRDHEIRQYLLAYNEKTLAVDTEAGALGQFCHETFSATGRLPSWAVIRGISDLADQLKDDAHRGSAAANAAFTLHELIPYLHASR